MEVIRTGKSRHQDGYQATIKFTSGRTCCTARGALMQHTVHKRAPAAGSWPAAGC